MIRVGRAEIAPAVAAAAEIGQRSKFRWYQQLLGPACKSMTKPCQRVLYFGAASFRARSNRGMGKIGKGVKFQTSMVINPDKHGDQPGIRDQS
jgi:hypothetical protein